MIELPIPFYEVRVPNPVFVRILIEARKILWDGVSPCRKYNDRYICYAASEAARCVNIDPAVPKALQDCIAQSLGGAQLALPVFNHWVSTRMSKDAWDEFSRLPDAQAQIQAARLRWLNQLIEEFGGASGVPVMRKLHITVGSTC